MPWYTIGLINNTTENQPELNLNDASYFATTQNGKLFFSSEEMDRWKECNLPNSCQAYQIFQMNNNKLLLLSKSGDVYCSETGENWLLVLSTGVTISEEVVPDRHFAFYDNYYENKGTIYCCLCVEDNVIYKTVDGISWDKAKMSNYYSGISIYPISNYMFKFNGNINNTNIGTLSASQGLKNWSGCATNLPYPYISDICSLDNKYAYIPVLNSNIYYKVALYASNNVIASANITTNTSDFSRVACSKISNSLIIGLKSTPYTWYYLDPTDKTKFIKVDNSNSEITNSSGYFYDEHKDRYIAQFSNYWCYIDASNVSSECTILDNATFPDSDTVVSSLIYKSNNNAT